MKLPIGASFSFLYVFSLELNLIIQGKVYNLLCKKVVVKARYSGTPPVRPPW